MKFKDWKCKQCGSADFALLTKDNSTQKGVYCNSCGKWLKWASKDEVNLFSIKDETTIAETETDMTFAEVYEIFKDMNMETCNKKEVRVKALKALKICAEIERMIKE